TTFRGSRCWSPPRGHAAAPYRPGARRPAGVDGTGQTGNRGPPGTGGDPVVSSAPSRPQLPGDQPQAPAAPASAGERTERGNAAVPPGEGNEGRRDGRQEVIAPG